MRRCRLASVLALVLLSACASLPPHAELPPEAHAHWKLSEGGRFLGSATAVAPDRLLTNRHVLPGPDRWLTATAPDGSAHPVRVLAVARRADVALLGLAGPVAQPLGPPARTPAPGAPLRVVGAVAGHRLAGAGHAEAAGAPPGLLVATLPAAPGFSGGPVLDAQGGFVGIVMAAMVRDRGEARQLSGGPGATAATARRVLVIPAEVALAAVAE
jgi:S1-C subfamily serine protease